MPAYTFDALDAAGQPRQGHIEADSARAARNLLRAQALVPLAVRPVTQPPGGTRRGWLAGRRVLGGGALAVWTRQLADLTAAGLPLEPALGALAAELDDERARSLMAALRAEVNAGASLAAALGLYPREFDDTYRAVVEAGEQGGRLPQVLDRMATELSETQALGQKLLGAALYPAIVALVALAIMVFLLGHVVPQVAQVYAGGQRPLPGLTRTTLVVSDVIRTHGLWLLLALVAAGVGLAMAARRPALRLPLDRGALRLPLVGRLAGGFGAARFASTLALLAGAGVPMLRALRTATDTLPNRAMREGLAQAQDLVREGAPLASALAGRPGLPALLVTFARLGEQTGQLPLMLERAAQLVSADVQRRAMRLATLLEPLLVVAMGALVMLIVLATLLPIIEINQWMGR